MSADAGGWVSLRLIPADGTASREVPLPDALLEAHAYAGIAGEVPAMVPALLRQLVLPVVLDALGPLDLPSWGAMLSEGQFTAAQREKITTYLQARAERFELARFAQVPNMESGTGATKPVTLLMPHVASADRPAHRATRHDEDPAPVRLAEAVRWAVLTQCWDTAAIKTGAAGDPQVKVGKTTGNPIGPLGSLGVVLPLGRNLFETIVLNLPTGPRLPGDAPQWDRPEAGPAWEIRSPAGVLDAWTWQARRIRLHVEDTEAGPAVRRVVVAAGDRMDSVPQWEPHTTWSITSDKKVGSIRRPRRHSPGREAWQGLDSLLALDRPDGAHYETSVLLSQIGAAQAEGLLPYDYPLRVTTAGMVYGTQSSVVDDILSDEIPLPVAALRADLDLRETVVGIAEQAQAAANAVNNLGGNLRRAAGLDPIPWDKGQRPGMAVLHALDPIVRRMLTGLQHAGDDYDAIEAAHTAYETWCDRIARAEADRLHAAAPASTFLGRVGKSGSKDVTFRQADAHRWFERALRAALPRLYPETTPEKESA